MKRGFIDYSHEVKLIASRPIRYLLICMSWLFVGLGALGAVLPLLPTTPFLILATICYARSSPRFYNWLMNHPRFGPDLRRWVISGSIRRKTKIIAIGLMAASMIPSIIYLVPLRSVQIGLALTGVCVACFIASRPEK